VRGDRRTISVRRRSRRLVLIVLVVSAPALASCGKKNSPIPPPGTVNTYPRSYPHE